jgi:2-keto-4-pentenoate hydratase
LAIVDRLKQRGGRVIGKKIAATSEAAQQATGLDGPGYGHLFDSYRVSSGGEIPTATMIKPVVECELTFLLKHNLAGPGITTADALAATESVMASFEVIDLRARDWKPGALEVIGYNGMASRFVLGSEPAPPADLDLPSISVTLKKNGAEIAHANSSAVLGNPAQAIAWLANKLTEHGSQLTAGEIILSGAIAAPEPAHAGDIFEARFQGLGSVSIRFI